MKRFQLRPWAAAAALTAALAAAVVGSPAPAGAQIADTTQVTVDSVVVTPEADPTLIAPTPDTVPLPISPRGAFLRSLVIPGWGQSAFESYFRGGVYFAGWAADWFMIFRNEVRLDDARQRFDIRVSQIEAELLAASPNPDSLRAVMDTVPQILEAAIEADEGPGNTGANLRNLVSTREQQREDWIAWSLFWILASGVDAYVTAHLADFPAAVDVRRNPDRSISLGLQLPFPARKP